MRQPRSAELRVANSNLARRLVLLSGKHTTTIATDDEIRRLGNSEQNAILTSTECASEKLTMSPKSISIRSKDWCQFAHGVAELHLDICHPRCKTQVCRMVLAGEPYPYGHRPHEIP